MKLTEPEQIRLAEIKARLSAAQGLWGSIGNLAGFAEHARNDYMPYLLSLVDRLDAEPEVVIRTCATCEHCRPSENTNRLFCTYHGEDYHEYEIYADDWCSYYGNKKEAQHE